MCSRGILWLSYGASGLRKDADRTADNSSPATWRRFHLNRVGREHGSLPMASRRCTPEGLYGGGSAAGVSNLSPGRPTLSRSAWTRGVEDLFHHVLAVLHDPAYREANAGGLRMEWPRIRLPGWPDGDDDGAAGEARRSQLREAGSWPLCWIPTRQFLGVTAGALRPEIAAVAVPYTTDGGNMTGRRFRAHGWLGTLRAGRGRHARPGPRRRATPTPHPSEPCWGKPSVLSARRRSTST